MFSGGVLFGLWIVYAIILFVLFWKAVVVVFNPYNAVVKSLVFSCVGGLAVSMLTCYFWKAAVVIILIAGICFSFKFDSVKTKAFVIGLTIVMAISIGVTGSKLKNDSAKRSVQTSRNQSDTYYDQNNNEKIIDKIINDDSDTKYNGALNNTKNSKPSDWFVKVIELKNSYLPEYSTNVTLGYALENFLSDPEWDYNISKSGEEIIICEGKGLYNNNIADVQASFKQGENKTVKVYSMSLNGKSMDKDEAQQFFALIYENIEGNKTYETNELYESDNNNDNYISDSMLISQDILAQLDKDSINFLINEMYAHHGYIFTNPDYAEYFGSQSWYNPQYNDQDVCKNEFNYFENENLKNFINYAQSQGWR